MKNDRKDLPETGFVRQSQLIPHIIPFRGIRISV